MKFLKKNSVNLLREFNSDNKSYILNRGKDFTISYEIELEAQSQLTDLGDIKNSFDQYFGRLIDKWDLDFTYDTSLIDSDQDQEVSIGNIYNFDDFADIQSEPTYEYHKLPDETTYFAGVEIAPFTYFNGINDAFKFLDEFYEIYNKQRSFLFSDKTGLHTNIGFHVKANWNLLKGYLLFNEDYAFTGFSHRKDNEFASSYKKQFDDKVRYYINKTYVDFGTDTLRANIEKIQADLNSILINTVREIGEKYVGFNITKVKGHNYIEFRHPGGIVGKEDLKRQTLYYSNVVLASVDTDYRKKDYHSKLFSFLNKMKRT